MYYLKISTVTAVTQPKPGLLQQFGCSAVQPADDALKEQQSIVVSQTRGNKAACQLLQALQCLLGEQDVVLN